MLATRPRQQVAAWARVANHISHGHVEDVGLTRVRGVALSERLSNIRLDHL